MSVSLSPKFLLLLAGLVVPGSLLAGGTASSSEPRVGAVLATFNIQHLGWDTGRSYQGVARIVAKKDWVAIQEVMSVEGLERLHTELENITGEPWAYVYSTPQGRSTYREKMAFLWRSERFDLIGEARLYPDPASIFARPPYAAAFLKRADGSEFVASTVHITFGDRIADRVPEIEAMGQSHWAWLQSTWPDQPTYMVLGDFNLRATHEAFDALDEGFDVLPIEQDTTLSTTDREYASPYDHIWVSDGHNWQIEQFGRIDFPERLSETDPDRYWSHEAARDYISDHAPVYLTINGQFAPYTMIEGSIPVSRWEYPEHGEALEVPACIDLNTSSVDRLQDLPGIGPAYAQAILDGRDWKNVSDLTGISGIGAATVNNIRASDLVCDLLN